jgi:hypothetical protein
MASTSEKPMGPTILLLRMHSPSLCVAAINAFRHKISKAISKALIFKKYEKWA